MPLEVTSVIPNFHFCSPVTASSAITAPCPRETSAKNSRESADLSLLVRGGPRNSDSLLRWDPDPGEGVWHATEETELSC